MTASDFVLGFGEAGWGAALLQAAMMTLAVASTGYAFGLLVGSFGAWAKIKGGVLPRLIADAYTTVLRGIPDILVIYLFYFGSSAVLTPLAGLFGISGFVSLPGFMAGALAIGLVSGAYQAEIMRGAYRAVSPGEIEAAIAAGMSRLTMFRRIIAPLVLRHALPGLGNVWQLVLKDPHSSRSPGSWKSCGRRRSAPDRLASPSPSSSPPRSCIWPFRRSRHGFCGGPRRG